MTMLRSMRFVTLLGGLATLCLLIAAPAQATHPRPVGASPARMSLVPAYAACAAPNRTHGPPLAFPSCNPPAQTSAQATVGTPDAFGGGANFLGYFKISVRVGTPGPPDDSDVYVRMDLRDVRCIPTGALCGAANAAGPADYSGEVGFRYAIRFTDHYNAVAPGGGTDPATMQDADNHPGARRHHVCRDSVDVHRLDLRRVYVLQRNPPRTDQGRQAPGRRNLGSACVRRRSRRRRQHDRRQHHLPAAGHLHPIADRKLSNPWPG